MRLFAIERRILHNVIGLCCGLLSSTYFFPRKITGALFMQGQPKLLVVVRCVGDPPTKNYTTTASAYYLTCNYFNIFLF